jgi:excisionase family DNA binding protein
MTVITEIAAARVPAEQVAALESFAGSLGESELRDLLFSLTASVKSGTDVTLLESDEELTPTQAADRLKMSRTHLYKLLDRGEIVSHRVGRDRRIRTVDLRDFELARQRDRRELAERFARTADTRAGAIAELVDDM